MYRVANSALYQKDTVPGQSSHPKMSIFSSAQNYMTVLGEGTKIKYALNIVHKVSQIKREEFHTFMQFVTIKSTNDYICNRLPCYPITAQQSIYVKPLLASKS